jgi:hypothetical protein
MWIVGEWLDPPGSPPGEEDNLLPWASTDDSSFDDIQLVRPTLASGRDLSKFYGRREFCVSRRTAGEQDAKAQQKHIPQIKLCAEEYARDLVVIDRWSKDPLAHQWAAIHPVILITC